MYMTNLLKTAQYNFAPDKKYNFQVQFPSLDTGQYEYFGGGIYGPGYDPCPYLTWFPAISVDVPIGWFVDDNVLDYYMIQVPVPTRVPFQRINLVLALDRYKKLESWFERWYETVVNGGKHMGTLREIARPFRVIKTYSNPHQSGVKSINRVTGEVSYGDSSKGFNYTTFFVVPTGQMVDQLEYRSAAKQVNIQFNIVGKFSDERAMERPINPL